MLTSSTIGRNVTNDGINYCGGTSTSTGAYLTVMGKDTGGYFNLVANNGTYTQNLVGYTSGTLGWSGLTFARTVNNSELQLCGGTNYASGASVILYGKDTTSLNGMFRIRAAISGSEYTDMCGWPNGALYWGSKTVAMEQDVIPRSLGPVMDNGDLACKNNTGTLAICSGTNSNNGGNIVLYANALGDANNIYRGAIGLYALTSGSSFKAMFLYVNGTWTWSGQPVQYSSDQRLKQQISNIDDKLLDAWEDVLPCQFKYNDAVDQKGDTARLHTGYVVQQIDEACKSHNLDISAYGLYCHEEYPERTEEVTIENEDGTTSKETKVLEPAKEYYSLRYTEALIVECAYLRREVKRLSERLEKLEK